MKKNYPSLPIAKYALVLVLILMEIACFVKLCNVFVYMTSPDAEGYLIAQEDFDAARIERLAYILGLLVVSLLLFYIGVVKGVMSPRNKNVLSAGYSIFLMLFIAEGALMFYPKSDAIGNRFSHHLWTRKYWNSYFPSFDKRNPPMQLRGIEDYARRGNSKKKIFVVGDSFCAGDGVQEHEMFTSILASKLPNIQVINICERGADTFRELDNLSQYIKAVEPVRPNVLIWQYYANDIERAATWSNLKPNYPPLTQQQKFLEELLKSRSFLCDYVYWELFYPDYGKQYMAYLANAFGNTKIVNMHLTPMEDAIRWCASNNIKLIVVIFPILGDLEKSEELYTTNLMGFLQSQGVTSIDMTPYLKEIPLKNRVVHGSNPHPTPQIHALTATKIIESLQKP